MRNNNKGNVVGLSRISRLCLVAVLSFVVIVAFGFGTVLKPENVYASDYAKWEDCDWDGYDDHTGVPVPWPGFDGTRGDTPSGPSPNSQTGKKQAEEAKQKAEAEKKAAAAAKKKAAEKKKKAEAKKKAAAEKKAAAAAKKAAEEKAAEEAKKAAEAAKAAGEEPQETPATKKKSVAKATPAAVADPAATTEAIATPAETVDDGLAAAEAELDAAIVETKGEIEITGAEEGSAIHEGSEIVIKGTGFYGDVAGIDVEIHSTPIGLGTVSSDSEGNFEATVLVPEGIDAGAHNIVLLYKGAELVRTPIEVNPAPANSFLKALGVGLTGDNNELAPGIILFIALVAIGLVALLVGDVRRRRKRNAVAVNGAGTQGQVAQPGGAPIAGK